MFCMKGKAMSNNAMSNETDLDWLAQNVHFWDESAYAAMCGGVERVMWASGSAYGQMSEFKNAVTKEQWLARRAELQEKPSWAHAPEWAVYMAQSPNGHWEFFAVKPRAEGWWRHPIGERSSANNASIRGAILGEWCDTLERRPVDLSEPAVTKRLDEATQNVLAAVPGLMDEKFKFEHDTKPVTVTNETLQLEQPISATGTGNGSATESAFLIGRVIDLLRTSVDHFSADELAELNELTGAELTKRDAAVCGGQKYLDAHWFEREELPPVGATVMHMGTATDKDWLEVEIIAHAQRKGFKVAVFEYPGGVSFSSATYFRPVRPERDVLLSIIVEEMNRYDTDGKLADAILAAGFSLRDK